MIAYDNAQHSNTHSILLKNVTNAQTLKSGTRNETEVM